MDNKYTEFEVILTWKAEKPLTEGQAQDTWTKGPIASEVVKGILLDGVKGIR